MIAALPLCALLGAADAGAPPAPARTAEAILDDYARAIGGPQAWKRHKSVSMKRRLEVKGMQISGTEDRYATANGRWIVMTDLVGLGHFQQGFDGKNLWSEDPINGLRILEGAEAEEAKVDGTWDAELRLKDLYPEVKTVPPPSAPPPGHRYECVQLGGKLAKPAVACFDAQTHLRVFQKGVHATPQGDVPYTVTFSDWREVDGMKVPYSEDMVAGPMSFVDTLTELKFDQKRDPKLFALPKAGQAKKKASKPTAAKPAE